MHSIGEIDQGRKSYAAGAWLSAYECLSRAERSGPLGGEDLELLARAAYMLGRDEHYAGGLERAHQAHLDAGEVLPAVRCAFWIGHHLMFRGEAAPASGWFARARRLLERHGEDSAERGYLLVAAWLQHLFSGEFEAMQATAAEAAEIGERFGDRDLVALAVMDQGNALLKQGRTDEGLRLVDETMVAVTAGELSPIVAGIVYCNTISFCRGAYELRRAQEWTAALTRWCEGQPDMVAHKGLCLVHRAEIMTMGGAWPEALEELRRLGDQFTEGVLNRRALGPATYQEGEVHRLRGEVEMAEAAYRRATGLGHEPQPGLALLRLATGAVDTAAAMIRRAISETAAPLKRAPLLPAYVEIMLAAGDLEAARVACRELDEVADRHGGDALRAMAAQARGATALAEGDPHSALADLRRACREWRQLGALHEAARVQALVASACASLGDTETSALELEAARGVCEELGAAPALAWIDSLQGKPDPADSRGLTARELEVLRLVAAGRTNRDIASALVISEHTVARHVQNIFAKLRVSSRTAASAFAFEHKLV